MPSSSTLWSRNNLGPLTSIFTPPSDCSTVYLSPAWLTSSGSNYLQAHQARYCTTTTTSSDSITLSPWPLANEAGSCWPTVTVQPPVSAFRGWGFYSPGLACPVGYQTACATVYGQSATQLSGLPIYRFQFSVTSDETVLGCCPSGYSCSKFGPDWQTCAALATSTTFAAVTCESDGVEASGTAMPIPYTTDSTTVTQVTLYAPLIQLNRREQDLLAPAPKTSTSPATSASSVSASPTSTSLISPSGKSDSGLSAGAIAGIVIAILVALIMAGGVFYWLRHRQSGSRSLEDEPSNQGQVPAVEMDGTGGVHELGDGRVAHEKDSTGVLAELPP